MRQVKASQLSIFASTIHIFFDILALLLETRCDPCHYSPRNRNIVVHCHVYYAILFQYVITGWFIVLSLIRHVLWHFSWIRIFYLVTKKLKKIKNKKTNTTTMWIMLFKTDTSEIHTSLCLANFLYGSCYLYIAFSSSLALFHVAAYD